MADVFKEVDEALREDRLTKLWKRYSRAVIALAVAVVAAVAGLQGWRAYDLNRRSELSDRYAAALEQAVAGQTAPALNAFADLSNSGDGGYPGLAAFERARMLAESGDLDGAVATWGRIAENTALGPGFRSVAVLLSAMHRLDDGDPAALRERLEPLAVVGQPFRASALEMRALLALREGDRETAREHYTKIADDRAAPSGVRARAAQMQAALKG